MQLTERHIIKSNHKFYKDIDALSSLSKNLYNLVNYFVRQEYFCNRAVLNLSKIYSLIKQKDAYTALPRKVSVQILIQVLNDWKSFIAAKKEYEKFPHKFNSIPNIPKYKNKKAGRNLLIYDKQAISKKLLRNKLIKLSKSKIEIQTRCVDLDQVRVVPKKGYYVLEVVYSIPDRNPSDVSENIASIDIGLNNLATVTSNQRGILPLLVNGRQLKSINRYYNKKRSTLQSKLGKCQHTSKQIIKLSLKRTNIISNYLHTYSRRIVDYLLNSEVDTLVIGKNTNWKQQINLGNKNNQEFVAIPHSKFVQMLEYKCKLAGIKVILTEESYTSKTSFLDNESPQKQENYLGTRIKRGLFKSSSGKLINADVNASLQIMKKVFPNAFSNGIEDVAIYPIPFRYKL